MYIIIKKGSTPKGRTRSHTDQVLNEAWGTTSFRNEEDKDKAKFIERQLKEKHGADHSHVSAKMISDLK